MNKKAVEDVYPLTPLQEGLLFHTLLAPSGGAYHDQFSALLHGPLDPDTLARAWRSVAANHAIFRTAFAWQTGKAPLQVVGRRADTPFVVLDWRDVDAATQAARRAALVADDVKQGFDPSKAPLMRITLVRLADATWFLLWSRHHLLLDGWSVSLVLREWLTTYQALLTGKPVPLSSAPPFRNYLGWLQKQDGARAEAFWRRELGDLSQPTPLGLAQVAEGNPTDRDHGEREVVLPVALSEAIRALARAARVTPATVFQGAWALLLARLGGERDIVFGHTVSGRPAELPGADAMVGMFINTLPLRARIDPARPLGEWLRALQTNTAEARQFEATPLVKIQGWTDVPRDRPLFETLLVYENYPVGEALSGELGSLRAEQVRSHERTHYASTLIVAPGDAFTLLMLHNRQRLPDALADRWLAYLQHLLAGMTTGVERPLATLEILPKAERARLIDTWNATDQAHDRTATLPDLVAAQVARTPSSVAVVDGTRRLTYAELASASDRLAAHLRERGAGPEQCVGVCLERSADLVIALLGVMKAGAAYVPLDPAYPPDRLAFMAGDARFTALVTQRRVADRLPSLAIPTVWLDEPIPDAPAKPAAILRPANLAYLIYTSGSTGRPKATAIEHRQAVAFVHWAQTVFTPKELAGVLFSTSVCFDLSIFELFVTLASGGKVIVAENALALPTLPARAEVTLVNTVPSAAAELVRSAGIPDSVLTVNLAGEPLTAALSDKLYAQPTIQRVYDLYGPSEDTTYSTCALRERGGPATIGRVIANSRLYLLDPDLQPVPVGAVGELWLAGEGLARGYLGRPDLTAERFLPDPFSREPGGCLYRTGDLARFREDGQIEFLGRGDHQVKIRGFRIELGEIQARLEAHAGVAEAAVLAREHPQRGPYIVAFAVAAPGANVLPTELVDWVRATLPHYMVPSAWHVLPVLPRTPNGKLDRKALPDDHDGPAEAAPAPSFRAAVTDPLTDLVTGIWSEVLGVSTLGASANFFELGGHSLLATQVVARVRSALGRDVPLRCLFDHPDLGGFVTALRTGEATATDAGDETIPPAVAGEPPPLSFAQERMWVLAQLAPDSPAYNLPATLELRGALDVAALRRALNAVVARHEPLRAIFPAENGRARMHIHPTCDLPLPVIDLSTGPTSGIETEARRRAEAEACTPFDLATGPLIRASLLRLAPDRHWVLFTVHHIIFDGWSEGVLVDDLMAAYAATASDAPSPCHVLCDTGLGAAATYGDFARWQRARAQSEVWARSVEFWRGQLADVEPLALPTDRERPAVPTYRGAQFEIVLPPALTDAVRALGRKEGATLFMTLLAAWEAVLAKQSGQDVFAIGTPVAGRTRREWEGLVGLFVNTLALRADVTGDPIFRDLLRRVRKTTLDAYAQQDLPFERVVEAVNPERDASRPALFQVMFSLQNQPAAELKLSGLTLSPVVITAEQSKFDLTLAARETVQGLVLAAEYATDLYERTTIERLLARYTALLAEVVKDPTRRVSALGALSAPEQAQVAAWSDGGAAPVGETVPVAVERQARATPDAIAVSQGTTTVTYRELIAAADRVASALRAVGVKPDEPVGIVLDRVPFIVSALLGVWRAGGAYVPVDPDYPAERIRTVLAETRAVVTTRALAARLPGGRTVAVVCVDALPASSGELAHAPAGGQLAYLLFTSGSTGKPKGVAVTHAGLANHMAWFNRAYGFGPADVVLQKTPYTFDASVWEFWAPLMTGGRIELAEPGSHRDPTTLAVAIRRSGVTRLQGVPSLLEAMVADGSLASCLTLTTIFAGGEALTAVLRDRIRQTLPVVLVNLYGPTETTIECVVWTVGAGEAGRVPIGRPVPGVRAYVLDRTLQPVASGVRGELFVGGAQLARGYWRDLVQTAERFLPDPFSPEPGARMYRTGDEVLWRADGVLEYLGRKDDQVKVRGFRIELGEVESALGGLPGVTKAVAAVRDGQLVGYLEWPSAPAGWRTTARTHLEASLPPYMVPSRWALVERWPVLTSGKVDRRALPAPTAETTDATAPQGPVEILLAKLWSELLSVPSVGREDNFFALGGDSILSLQVVARAATAGVKLSAQAVFRHQTLMQLAAVAETVTTTEAAPSDHDVGGEYVLTPIQRWFFAQALPEPAHWNQSALFVTPAGFDPVRFETALRRVVTRHDAFHLRYRPSVTGWAVSSGDPVASVQVDTAPLAELAAMTARIQAGLDLASGPLLRAGVFSPTTPGDEGRLLLVVHHLAIDGVSWRWLIEELAQAYTDPSAVLPAVPTAWSTWTRRLAREAFAETTCRELPFWEAMTVEPLPRDQPTAGRGNAGEEAILTVALGAAETKRLLQDSAAAYRTQVNDLLLTALAQTLARWTGRSATTIALEGHGREEIAGAPDITRTIGWFTTLAPVTLSLEGAAGDGDAIKQVKEQLRAIPRRGLGYGLLRYLGDADTRARLAVRGEPELCFNYLGQVDAGTGEGRSAGFAAAPEARGADHSPANPRAFLIEVNAVVAAGELRCTWHHSPAHHTATTIRRLAEDFQHNLSRLVAHCVQGGAGGLTPSDFPEAQVSQDDLDKLLDRLE